MKIASQLCKLKKSALVQNAGWMFAGQGLSFIVQALYFLVLARLLGSLQYGVLAGAAAFVAVANQYSSMGAGYVLLRHVSLDKHKFRQYWGNVLLSTAIFGSMLVIVLQLAGRWMIGQDSAGILLMIAIGDCICGQLTLAASQVFQTFERMRITAMLNLITNMFRLVLAIGLLFGLHHASARQWAIASLIVSIVAVTIAVITVTKRFGWPIFSPSILVAHFGEGISFAVSGSTTSVYNDVDKVMLGHYGMTAANGIYTMAYRVVNIGTMPIMSIHAASFPRFFRVGVHGAGATMEFEKRILKRTFLISLFSAIAIFLAAPLIPLFLGKSFSESVNALRWLCLIPVFRSLHVGAGDAMAGAGYQRIRLAVQAVAAVANLMLNLSLVPRYSWFGAAIASLLTDGGLAIMSWTALHLLKVRDVHRMPLDAVQVTGGT
jgi:O-antigen/teichoic acid export membrane protein